MSNPRFIYCANGCGRPAREVGQPADCPDCGKTLCEECCTTRTADAPYPGDGFPESFTAECVHMTKDT